jgi:hypothetical protein
MLYIADHVFTLWEFIEVFLELLLSLIKIWIEIKKDEIE